MAVEVRRTQLQLSQELISEAAEMSQSYYSEIERGARPLPTLTHQKLMSLARALKWSLGEMQRATGVDLGIVEATLVAEGSADVYALTAALTPDQPGPALDHEAVAPGIRRPLLLRADTDEMIGTSPASIRPGSTLHIDQAETVPEEGRVYVLTDQDGVHLRIYTMTRLGAVFRAENRTFEDIPATEARVVGRVVSVASDYDPNLK
ncbi:helix-turn-helix domain-containing protein [uncultured Deinococcus sp.]|uniref:helix-turn-helix domain-containing protein n=1 Tax=uncultured Deinococcus sp. TaxID=158789 RepID=UPI0025834E3C|nr:helix-turn-helix domain-containing protein [uncultured Deinococcus sp.]